MSLDRYYVITSIAVELFNIFSKTVILIKKSNIFLGVRAKHKSCDLDAKDKFWVTHKGAPFPNVAEAIQEELEQYKSSEEEVKKLKSSMGIDNESELAVSMVTDNTAKITSAVQSLPQLLEKKRLIDMHTSIATGKNNVNFAELRNSKNH